MEQPKKKTDLEKADITGPVKQVMETRYKAHLKAGAIVEGKIDCTHSSGEHNFILTFNEAGTKIKEELFGTNGNVTKTFNEKGQETESVQYLASKLYQKTVYKYNEKGNALEIAITNADGSLHFRNVYKYNEYGQPIEYIHYVGKEEQVRGKTTYTYDDRVVTLNGITYRNLLTNIEYDGEGNIKRKNVNTWNEQGKITESITEYTEEPMRKYSQRSVHKYNKQGDCIEYISYDHEGSIKHHSHYSHEYDSEGKKIVEERSPYNAEDEKKPEDMEKCENDSQGNWIKKTTLSNNIPVNIFHRQIIYFGEAGIAAEPLVHPLTLAPKEEVHVAKPTPVVLSPEDAKWLAEGINSTAETFPVLRYYTVVYKEPPSVVTYTGPHIEAFALLHELKENMGAQEIHSYSTVWGDNGEQVARYTLNFSRPGYLLHAAHISGTDEEEFDVPDFMEDYHVREQDGQVYTSQFMLLRPAKDSDLNDEYFMEELEEYISKCSLRKKPDKPTIYMIEVEGNSFSMEEHPVSDDFEIRDLDVHYGYGFEKFHNDLMHRFRNETKGLVLFHGLPGTGKTFYIRHLLRKMVSTNRKVVIYMPPNMVDHLVEPAFMTFLMGEVKRWSSEGFFSVLLIEDAEPLLAKRVEGVRIQGVTNLLNMSDGLLNDMLNLQIICTFNVDVKKLDSALLRPGRLIARKEFKPLSVLDANLLASRLGIKHHFEEPATLSEIYALRKNKNTLIHDVEPDRDASSVIDDLI